MSRLHIDFVVYPGDPDEGVKPVPSAKLIEPSADRSGIEWPGAYGAIVITGKGKQLSDPIPDPIFSLVVHMVRTVASLLEGESETVELQETEFGFLFEPSGEDVMVSSFSGTAFEPEEYILQEELVSLDVFAEQLMGMGERLKKLVELTDPGLFERDEYSKSLLEYLDLSGTAFTSFKREKERGLR